MTDQHNNPIVINTSDIDISKLLGPDGKVRQEFSFQIIVNGNKAALASVPVDCVTSDGININKNDVVCLVGAMQGTVIGIHSFSAQAAETWYRFEKGQIPPSIETIVSPEIGVQIAERVRQNEALKASSIKIAEDTQPSNTDLPPQRFTRFAVRSATSERAA